MIGLIEPDGLNTDEISDKTTRLVTPIFSSYERTLYWYASMF
jgi:hypothetical protein